MFAYCGNCPIISHDVGGTIPAVNTMMTDSGSASAIQRAYSDFIKYWQYHNYTYEEAIRRYYSAWKTDSKAASAIHCLGEVCDKVVPPGIGMVQGASNLAYDIQLGRTTTKSTIALISKSRSSSNTVAKNASRFVFGVVLVSNTVSGIIRNIENDAPTAVIVIEAFGDVALTSGTHYVASKIGAGIGSAFGPGWGTAIGYLAGLGIGILIDLIRSN